MPHRYFEHDRPIGIAHRGGAGDHPENTVAAFRAAHDLGFVHLETDVHLTADGVVVAFHDPDLARVTDRSGRIGSLRWDEIADCVVGRTEVDGARIPRLIDLLDAFPDAMFNIDAKSDDVLEPLLDVLADAGAEHRVCVASFHHRRLARARRRTGGAVVTSASRWGILSGVARSIGLPVPRTGGGALQAPPRFGRVPVVTRRFVEKAHRDGLVVHVWTVDDPDEMHRLLDLGVDGIMTDRPEVLRRVYRERGIW